MSKVGISTYFLDDRIRIRHGTIEELGCPEYIHLRINEKKKYLFIEKCEKDMDAFHILYHRKKDGESKQIADKSCYINARNFLRYLAHVIGVPEDSPSLRFEGYPQEDGTVFFDLNKYTVIPRSKGVVDHE